MNSPRLERGDQVVQPLQGHRGRTPWCRRGCRRRGCESGPDRVSRSPSRTRLMPDRASRSASSVGAFRLEERRGRDQADAVEPGPAPLLPKVRWPSLRLHEALLPGGGGEQEREVEGRFRRRSRGELGTLSQSSVSSAAWKGTHEATSALGEAVTVTSSIRILPPTSALLELEHRPPGARRHADLGHVLPPVEAARPDEAELGVGARDRPAQVVEEEEPGAPPRRCPAGSCPRRRARPPAPPGPPPAGPARSAPASPTGPARWRPRSGGRGRRGRRRCSRSRRPARDRPARSRR